jgi:hypothetical protein
MPENMKFVHGSGCPVCVLPISRIDQAIHLVEAHDPILCTYGDLLRVPASGRKSLIKVKAAGGDVRMVYSTQDALRIARENPHREVVLFAIGFETTTPPSAVALQQAKAAGVKNFSVFCNHVLTSAAIQLFLYDARAETNLHGEAGVLIARCGPVVCRATTDGAVWIGHLRDPAEEHPFKLPASRLLSDQIESLPEIVEHRLPMGADEACKLGLVERIIESRGEAFVRQVERLADSTIRAPAFAERLEYKNA